MKNSKFNIVDVIIITVLILVIAAVSLRAINTNNSNNSEKDRDIVYTVEVYGIDSTYRNSIKAQDKVFLSGKALYCGTVDSVRAEYTSQDIVYSNGSIKSHINPSKSNLIIQIAVSADIADNGFFVGENTFITGGDNLEFYTEYFTFSGKVTNIQIK